MVGQGLRCADLLVLTEEREGTERAEWAGLAGTIRYVPLWRWLLADAGSTGVYPGEERAA